MYQARIIVEQKYHSSEFFLCTHQTKELSTGLSTKEVNHNYEIQKMMMKNRKERLSGRLLELC